METVQPTMALSSTEREDFRIRFEKRLEKVKAKTADVFAFKEVDQPPFIVNSALYTAFGLNPETFPDRYYDDPQVMIDLQERNYYEQLKEIDDDFVPYLMPWFGTAVTASALGCQVDFPPKLDPTVNPRHYPVRTPEDVKGLQIADPERRRLDAARSSVSPLHAGEQFPSRRDYGFSGPAHHGQSAHGIRQAHLPDAGPSDGDARTDGQGHGNV